MKISSIDYDKITLKIKKLGTNLMLCMLNMGMPQSTVRIPERVAIIGPIVDPHPESDL